MGFKGYDDAYFESRGGTVGPPAKMPPPADGEWNGKPVSGIAHQSTEIESHVWAAYGIPVPVSEFKFCERRWRLDYAWVAEKLALEIEGGVWSDGRHTRGSGFKKDITKYNRLTVLGWHLLRTTPDEIGDGSIFKTIRQALGIE